MKKPKLLFLLIIISAITFLYYKSLHFDTISKIAFQAVVLFLVPLVIVFSYKAKALSHRERLAELGLSFAYWKKIILYSLILIAIAIPIMLYASTLPVFKYYYPMFFANNLNQFIRAELLILPSFLFLEFFYRGFALFQLKKYTGNWAILIQAVPYTLIHWGKPMPEFYYSFFAGLVFAYVCLKAKSFLPAFASHYITSVIFDFLCW